MTSIPAIILDLAFTLLLRPTINANSVMIAEVLPKRYLFFREINPSSMAFASPFRVSQPVRFYITYEADLQAWALSKKKAA